jgi:outer membrane protein assembly factor BamB
MQVAAWLSEVWQGGAGRSPRRGVVWGVLLSMATALAPSAVRAARSGHRDTRPRLVHVVDLPGYWSRFDPNGRTIYLVRDTSTATEEVIAFDWRRRRVRWRWRSRAPRLMAPVGVAAAALVVAEPLGGDEADWPPLVGLDRRTGRVRWRQAPDHESGSGITVVGDRIYTPLMGRLVCLSAVDGHTVWDRGCRDPRTAQTWPRIPVVTGGGVFTQQVVGGTGKGDGGTRVVALRARDGSNLWSHFFPWIVQSEAPDPVRRLVAVKEAVVALMPTGDQEMDRGRVGFLAPPSALYCWNARTGRQRWQQPAPWTNKNLLVTPESVVLSPDPGVLMAYSLADGRKLWRFDSHLQSYPSTSLARGREVFVCGETVDRQSHVNRVFLLAVDAMTGRLKWRLRLPHITGDLQEGLEIAVDRGGTEIQVLLQQSLKIGDYQSRLYVIAVPHHGHRQTR